MKSTIKTGGRPAKSSFEKQQKVVSTKLSQVHFYAIQRRAKEAGISLSEYTRQTLINGRVIARLSKEDAETLRKLAGEANNLNQLAKSANKWGMTSLMNELLELKDRIINILNQLSDDWKNRKRKRI